MLMLKAQFEIVVPYSFGFVRRGDGERGLDAVTGAGDLFDGPISRADDAVHGIFVAVAWSKPRKDHRHSAADRFAGLE